MNKKLYVGFILILLIFLPVNINSNELPEITVRVNPNFELLAVVYTLAAENPRPINQEYFDDLMDYFGDYKDHEAVKSMKQKISFDQSTAEGFFFKEQRALLNTSDPPEMKTDTEDNFIDLLRDFAVKTNFMEFYNEHQNYYQEFYDFLYENTAIEEIPSLFSEFFGFSMNEMHIESSYLYIPCKNHAIWEGEGKSVIGYFINNGFSNHLNEDELNRDAYIFYFNRLMLHEFGHATADMLGNHGKMFDTFSYILDPARNVTGGSVITIDHTYIAVFEAWGLDQIHGEPWGELLISQYCAGGFHICPYIYELIKTNYMSNRDMYPTFDEYIPHLCTTLEEIVTPYTTKEYYEATIYTSLTRFYSRGSNILIIYGTQNPDPTGTEHDKEFAEVIASYFFGSLYNVAIKKDTDVTEDDLSQYNFILIGGPVSNKITEELNENLPIKFEKENEKWGIVHNLPQDTLVFSGFYDKLVKSIEKERYEDPNIGVMEAFRNPYNEEKYGVLIAGNAREGTANSISVSLIFRFLFSYQIGDNERVYEQGFYRD